MPASKTDPPCRASDRGGAFEFAEKAEQPEQQREVVVFTGVRARRDAHDQISDREHPERSRAARLRLGGRV